MATTRAGRLGRAAAAMIALAAVAAGCRDRPREETPEGAPQGAPAAGRVEVRLDVPPEVAWNGEDTVVATVTNGTPAPLAGAVLHLFVEDPVAALPDSAGGVRADVTAAGTRVEKAIGTLAPGLQGELRQAVRLPPAPAPRSAAPR
ncbi:MAG TPA: hypothetical protein VHG91_11385, partial [Longimicrobium sp.]|nr:hypothetical protein [Longimicrobium sp.]